jgi:hypothetical protein
MRGPALPLLLLAGLALGSCGPVSPELAAQQCQERARNAAGPTGEIYAGATTNGPAVGGEITITSDWITGRDPYEVYDSCVRQMSGQGPIRPLDLGP